MPRLRWSTASHLGVRGFWLQPPREVLTLLGADAATCLALVAQRAAEAGHHHAPLALFRCGQEGWQAAREDVKGLVEST